MHREIQIKQFPIVTTHWWPKTRNERFVWENEQYLYRFLPLVHNHVQVIWVHTHIRCVTCVCARSGLVCARDHFRRYQILISKWTIPLITTNGIYFLSLCIFISICRRLSYLNQCVKRGRSKGINTRLTHVCLLKGEDLLNACSARFLFLSNICYWTVQLLMYVENSFMNSLKELFNIILPEFFLNFYHMLR